MSGTGRGSGRGDEDRCFRAAQAALQVMSERCGDDAEAKQIKQDMVALIDARVERRTQDVDPDRLSDREIDRLIAEEEWLDDWTAAMCNESGITSDDENYRQCRRNWARRAIQ